MSRSRLADSAGRRLGLALCAGLALALAACDGESDTAVAIRESESRLRALSPAGAQPASVEYRKTVYTDIRGKLQPTLSKGTRAENASAAVLLAHSQAGLAQIPAENASELAEESLHQQAEVPAVVSRWLAHTGMARAAASFDPAPELSAIEAEVRKADEALNAAQQRKAGVDKQVADLRAQAAAKTDESRGLRQQGGALRARIPNETAVSGAALLEQARGLGRRADALEVEAANLVARAAQVAPLSGEIQLEIDNLNLQKQMLAQSRAAVQKRAADAKAQEQQARAEAATAAAELEKRLAALAERQEQLKALTGEAVEGFTAAATSARQGAQELKTTGQVALGAAQQSAGDALWTLAQSHASLAETMEAVSKAPFKATELASQIAANQEAAKAALEQATQAYQAAYDAYSGANARAEAAEVLEKLKARLGATLKKVSGGAVDMGTPDPAEAPPPAEPAATPGAAAAGGGADTPQALLERVMAAAKAGNGDRLVELTHVENEADAKLIREGASLVTKFKALEDAMKSRFGSAAMPGTEMMGGGGLAHFDADPSQVRIEVDGDLATATFPGGETEKMVKVDGRWKIAADPAEMEMARQMAPMFGQMGSAIDELTADINAGKFASAEEAMMALGQKMMGAMGGMPGGMPGGPGGKR